MILLLQFVYLSLKYLQHTHFWNIDIKGLVEVLVHVTEIISFGLACFC